jgi:hypothetical protein
VTSARLRRHVELELLKLQAGGRRDLVQAFLALDHGADLPRLEAYLEGCRELARRAQEEDARELALVLRYFLGRTLAYPLDRPQEAAALLVELAAELSNGPRRGGVVQSLTELELLRAFHKLDAPGYRREIVAGARELWPRLGDDLGPQTELLDVLWRTGYWCRDAALMREAHRLGAGAARTLRFSAGYWRARELWLERRHEEAIELLEDLLEARHSLEEAGEMWRHYLSVELAANEAEAGRPAAALERLDRVATQLGRVRDPMLLWDLARARAAAARAGRDDAKETAAWSAALDVVEGLGTDRLAGEFALALAQAAARRGDGAALSRARAVLDVVLPRLRSAADLREPARAVPGLYS